MIVNDRRTAERGKHNNCALFLEQKEKKREKSSGKRLLSCEY